MLGGIGSPGAVARGEEEEEEREEEERIRKCIIFFRGQGGREGGRAWHHQGRRRFIMNKGEEEAKARENSGNQEGRRDTQRVCVLGGEGRNGGRENARN